MRRPAEFRKGSRLLKPHDPPIHFQPFIRLTRRVITCVAVAGTYGIQTKIESDPNGGRTLRGMQDLVASIAMKFANSSARPFSIPQRYHPKNMISHCSRRPIPPENLKTRSR